MENTIVEALRKLTENQNDNEIATEEDWDNCFEELPHEFEYEDLGAAVRTDEDEQFYVYGGDIRSKTLPSEYAVVNEYTLYYDPDYDLILEYLGKKDESEVTKGDLIRVANNPEDYSYFMLEKFRKETKEEVEKELERDPYGLHSYLKIEWYD